MIFTFIIGATFLVFARPIINRVERWRPDHLFGGPIFREIFVVWTLRAIGIMTLVLSFWMCIDNPPRGMMNKDENRLILLEEGKITEGEVVKTFYQEWASEGWKLLYKINVENLVTGEEKTYWGSAQGPKKYYANLLPGEPITIIYYPLNPKINCEIKYMLNYPGYRKTFQDVGKLALLDKYRDEYELEDYALIEWFRLQWQK
jgi:hypothetical protein